MRGHHAPSSKPRTKVKPILKKLTQSERNSLDLDRPAAEQDGLGIHTSGYGTGSRSSHDVVFSQTGRRGYHNRSTSGTSQFSTATAGSVHRTGSFVHPFQQTPRPYTPPLAPSYQGSLMGSEYSRDRDSPALTEDEDQLRHTIRSTSNLSNRTPPLTGASSPIISQPLRIQTIPTPNSRLALSTSHSNLHSTLNLNSDLISPTDTMSPTSAVRSSIDKGFRIRSRSEVDTRARSESIQEARRKFERKEQAKEEKAAREEIRALEKRNQKEARQIERGHRKSSTSDGARSKRSKSDLTMHEKGDGFIGWDYNSVPIQTPPHTAESFEGTRRGRTTVSTKKKTHSAWTRLVMWLRTRFMRMGKSRGSD